MSSLLRVRGWGMDVPAGVTVLTVFDTGTGRWLSAPVDEQLLECDRHAEEAIYSKLERDIRVLPGDRFRESIPWSARVARR